MKQQKIAYVLHHAHSLLSLADELVLRLLNLRTGILAQAIQVTVGSSLLAGLDGVEREPGVLDVLASLGREHQVGVEGGVPARQETGLDLGVLGQTGLAHLLLGQSVLLQRRGERVLALGALDQGLGAGERGARDRMVEGLGLRLGGRRCGQGSLGLGGRASLREQLDLFVDRAA